ncbi:MAG: ATP-binding cassette domain-containing protein [Archangium sp.]|nr:ATP-binding cassette domain-containing protein [Archangium sp.]
MIEVRGLCKRFGEVEVLRGLDLDVYEGETFVLLGGSGSGKTVLMKHLEGLLRPDAGTVRIAGHDVSGGARRELDATHRLIGVAFQAGALFDSMTVFDNVAFPLREQLSLSPPQIAARVEEVLGLLGLGDAGHKLPAALSGGMKKRVAFARALVLRPRVLLADEPTAGLDPLTTEAVDDAIISAQKALGATAFIITHDLPTAFRIADRIGLLHEGRIIEAAPPEQFRQSQHPAVKAFLHDWLERERAEGLVTR